MIEPIRMLKDKSEENVWVGYYFGINGNYKVIHHWNWQDGVSIMSYNDRRQYRHAMKTDSSVSEYDFKTIKLNEVPDHILKKLTGAELLTLMKHYAV